MNFLLYGNAIVLLAKPGEEDGDCCCCWLNNGGGGDGGLPLPNFRPTPLMVGVDVELI